MTVTKMSAISTMMTGIIMSSSAKSWLAMWVGMEMNLLGFIPLMLKKNSLPATESAMSYFMIQAVSSSLMIMGVTSQPTSVMYSHFTLIIITTAMMIKMAAAPWHIWLPKIAIKSSWIPLWVMMTIQKIIPFTVIYQNSSPMISNLAILSSAILGPLGMYKKTSLKTIMAYSSITNMSWMITLSMLKSDFLFTFIILYSVSMLSMISILKINLMNSLSQVNLIKSTMKIPLILNTLSSMGIPPLIDFWLKAKTIMACIRLNGHSSLIPLILITSAMASMVVYLSFIYPMMMSPSSNQKSKSSYMPWPILVLTLWPMSWPIMVPFIFP